MFKVISGSAKVEWFPKIASTVFTNGGLVYADGSGAIQPADATAGDIFGIILKTIAATDDDYASTTRVPIQKIYAGDVIEADVTTGTLTAAMVGNQYDLTDANGVDVTATSKLVVTCVGFISASKGLFKINAIIETANVATT